MKTISLKTVGTIDFKSLSDFVYWNSDKERVKKLIQSYNDFINNRSYYNFEAFIFSMDAVKAINAKCSEICTKTLIEMGFVPIKNNSEVDGNIYYFTTDDNIYSAYVAKLDESSDELGLIISTGTIKLNII